jgi:gliding motility-associated-like protein
MMVSGNHGFQFKLVTESPFRALICGSSEVTDPTNRPKLKVIYQTNCAPNDTSQISLNLCPGDVYNWQGQAFTAPLDTNITFGCDSIVFIQLQPFTADTFNLNATVCSGELFEFNGMYYPEGTQTYVSVSCDSVVNLQVAGALPSFEDTLEVEGCLGQTMDFFGQIIGFPSFSTYQSVGCDSIIHLNAVVKPNCLEHCEAFIPNSFTPNGDNINDVFALTISTQSTFVSMVIFNRWGELVFENNQDYPAWDGTWRGQEVPQEVYFYKLDYRCDDQPITRTGFLTLLR